MTRAGAVLALLIGPLAGCSGSFHFDNRPRDAGQDGCAGPACSWQTELCDAESCDFICPRSRTCIGTCESTCSLHCEENSRCTLAASEASSVACEAGARCEFSLASQGRATCQANATCNVRCTADCSLICEAGATCTLGCGSATARAVSGNAGC